MKVKPAVDSNLKIILCGITLAFCAFFMVGVIYKYLEFQKASLWIPATCRIVSARTEARKITKRVGSGRSAYMDFEFRNFAAIRYVFEVDGKQVEGTRISIWEDPGNFQVEETLKRYPVGKTMTVYYDGENPNNCVLHRDAVNSIFKIAITAGGLIGVCGLITVFVSSGMGTLLVESGVRPGPIFLAVLCLITGLFGSALRKRGLETFRWPRTTGTIVSSAVDKLEPASHFRRFGRGARFRVRTVYTFCVSGVTYKSDNTSLGGESYSNISALLRGNAGAYKPGQKVDVFYNTDVPAQSVLRRGAPGQATVWLAAIMFAGLAVYWQLH